MLTDLDCLSSLPAVKAVKSGRIMYADEFKRRVAADCRRGESPVEMFRAAGLGPELIGYKRIERCVARWRGLDPTDDGKALPPRGSAPMIVVLAQEGRINAIERRLVHVTDVLREMGVDA